MGRETKTRIAKIGGAIAYMARNSVAANLTMLVVAAAGAIGLLSIKQEIFPEFSVGMVTVNMAYPGSSPEEIEQGIVLAIEDEVLGIDGVQQVNSSASEGMGLVVVEVRSDADEDIVLADVTSAVERITTFPEDAEEPTISLASKRSSVISLVISGDQDLRTLHDLAEQAREELLQREEITQVELQGVPPLEVSIEVPREQLEALGLTLDQVAQQIRAASVELPGGNIETSGGEIMVRLDDRRRWGHELEDVIIRGMADGFELRLGDFATVHDGYEDTHQAAYFDGDPAVRLVTYRVGDETPTTVAAAVREVIEQLDTELPSTVTLSVWDDRSKILRGRIDLLARNAWMGFMLVLIILGLFLKARLAGWIALGIPISLLGAIALMPSLGLSVNMITLMAVIITLGLVVDDAIVVGENIYKRFEDGLSPLEAAIVGAKEMALPVTFSVLTSIAAFSPLFFIPGVMGKVFWSIPAVVVSVLIFSLIESFFILPAHLGHQRHEGQKNSSGPLRWLAAISALVSRMLKAFTERAYRPALTSLLRWRYTTLASAVAVLAVVVSFVASGIIPYSFFPQLEEPMVSATVTMPYGTPGEHTRSVRQQVETAGRRAVVAVANESGIEGLYTRVGEGATGHFRPPETGSHLLTVEIALSDDVSAAAVAEQWREGLGSLAGVESLSFNYAAGPTGGAAVDVQLSHSDPEVLASASEDLAVRLGGYQELINVENSYAEGKQRLDFSLLPTARSLGLTGNDVARQLRNAFYGAEALREQRGRNELKVMVRLPDEQRRSEHDLDQMLIRTPSGGDVPLEQVASFERDRAPTIIDRENGRRVVDVSAELAPGVETSREVLASLRSDALPELEGRYPGLSTAFVGEQQEQQEVFSSLVRGFALAMIVVFALLAVPLRSYSQPLVIMSVIPFGFVGATIGHVIVGIELSIMSVLGIVALSGVVVNDSLLLIDATNKALANGMSHKDAIISAATRRLRPILLTSLTTFFGLSPMILETSVQAKMLIPMAVSLGFGILFATVIVLVLVPALYLILQDVRNLLIGFNEERDRTSIAPRHSAEVVAD